VPSSISSSNNRLPDGPTGRIWLLAIVLALGLGAAIESYWRSQGQRMPMVVDDKDNWSLQREKLSDGTQQTVALLGMSRIQLGFATQVFYDRYPHYTLGNLCIEGLAPFATLRDLASDESFKGVAIVEITEPGIQRELHESQKAYVEYFHTIWRFDKRIVRRSANAIQSNLVLVSPSLCIRELLTKAIEGQWPAPNYLITHADRSRLADFSKADMNRLWMFLGDIILGDRYAVRDGFKKKDLNAKIVTPAIDPMTQWLKDVAEFDRLVQAIQARGGKVVFVRYPTSGPTGTGTDLSFPRDRYWDIFAKHISASTIHYDDAPGLRGFPTPDWSHLGEADAHKFTAVLLDELEKQAILTPVR